MKSITACLNLVVLRVTDIEVSGRFYAAFGINFIREKHGNGPEHLSGQSGSLMLELYPLGSAASTAAVRLGFSVPLLAPVIHAVTQTGGYLLSEPQSCVWGLRAVVSDPDGHKIELLEITVHA
jgi:lactoylglutathione lyase